MLNARFQPAGFTMQNGLANYLFFARGLLFPKALYLPHLIGYVDSRKALGGT
jgi:hypothetical protein